MPAFKDNGGRTWEVVLTVYHLKRVRSLLGVDLLALADDGASGLGGLLGDVVRLVDVLFVLVKDQADARNVSDESFGRALGGDALEAATAAFLEALADFFPSPRQRAALRKLTELGRAARDAALARTEEALGAVRVEEAADALLSGGSSGSVPGSSGSTRAPSPSANSS